MMTRHLTLPRSGLGRTGLALVLTAGLAGCADMSSRETRNTAIGAGVGGLGGAILSGGDPWVTGGGAVAGGVIGNILTDDDDDRDRYRRDRDRRRPYRR